MYSLTDDTWKAVQASQDLISHDLKKFDEIRPLLEKPTNYRLHNEPFENGLDNAIQKIREEIRKEIREEIREGFKDFTITIRKTEENYEKMNPTGNNIRDKIHYFLTQNKTLIILITIFSIIGTSVTIYDHFYGKKESSNLEILHKINIHNDDKIIFKAEERKGEEIWNYETTFNLDFDLWSENPSTLNIYFINFSKFNNTVKKDYMSVPFDDLNYKIYPEKNNIYYNIEPNDRKRNLSLKFYLNDFEISGKYVLTIYSPDLNFYLGNVILLINYTDLKSEREINETINIPVYWMNEVYRG